MNELGSDVRDKIRVYLLDDHDVVRRGVRELLESSGDIEVVGESGSAAQATGDILALQPQVAVLDAKLPDGSGIDVCREVVAKAPNVAVLILTSYDEDEAVLSAFMAGAAGFLLKQIRDHRLIESVHLVAAGESLLGDGVTRRVVWTPTSDRPADHRLPPLTPEERGVLECVGEGMTNRQIGEAMGLEEKTVQGYLSSLLSKLGLDRREAAFVTAKHVWT
jgi:two-component system, NarL family, response regulator DevR